MSDSLGPQGLQHTRLLCPSLSPGVCSNSFSLELAVLSNRLIPCHPLLLFPGGFLGGQVAKMKETRARSLGPEYPLEEEMAAHASILPWEFSWTEEPGGL